MLAIAATSGRVSSAWMTTCSRLRLWKTAGYDPNEEYFKVRTVDGMLYLLRCDSQTSEWTLQSGFDGAALLAGTSIKLITIDPQMIRAAEQ